MTAHGAAISSTAVYDERRLLGFVFERRDGAEAIRSDGSKLGLFNDQCAAARAVFAASRHGGMRDKAP